MRCSGCGRVGPSGRFCTQCGRALEGEVQESTPGQAEADRRELDATVFALRDLEGSRGETALSGEDYESARRRLTAHRDLVERRIVGRLASLPGHDSIPALKEFVSSYPRSIQAHMELGRVYKQSGRHREAIVQYSLAASAAPRLPAPRLHLAELFDRLGLETEALYEYSTYLVIEPDRHKKTAAARRVRELQDSLLPEDTGEGSRQLDQSPEGLRDLLSALGNIPTDRTGTIQRLTERYTRRLGEIDTAIPTAPSPPGAAPDSPAARRPAEVRERGIRPTPPAPRPAPTPREPIDWGALWAALFSERALTAVLGFGVLLVAVSSLVLLVSAWGTFPDWVRQLFLAGQLAMFLVVGHVIKEKLGLHLSGLAIISIAALWVPINVGTYVFEILEPPGERLLPGIGIQLDLPMYGWLIIAATCVPSWGALTYRYRGHLLMQGTIAAVGATVALTLAVLGAPWEWQVASLAALTPIVVLAWHWLRQTSFEPIAEPLYYTAQAALGMVSAVLIAATLLGEANGYSVGLATLAGLAMYLVANRLMPRLAHEYPIAALPVAGILLSMVELGLDARFFDAVLMAIAVVYVGVGRMREGRYEAGLLKSSTWPVLQPAYSIGFASAALAISWPAVDTDSRLVVMYTAAGISAASARWWGREVWSTLASVFLFAAFILTLDRFEDLEVAHWAAPIGLMSWAYLGIGLAVRRTVHAVPMFVSGLLSALIAVFWAILSADLAVLSAALPPAMPSFVVGAVITQGRQMEALVSKLKAQAANYHQRQGTAGDPPDLDTIRQWASAALLAIAGALLPVWTTSFGRWVDVPGTWAGVDILVVGAAFWYLAYRLSKRGLPAQAVVLAVLGMVLSVVAPIFHVGAEGMTWTLAGIFYANVALAAVGAYALRSDRLAYVSILLFPLPYALTLDLSGLETTDWAVYWAVLACAYFAVAVALKRAPGAATPTLGFSFVLALGGLAWSAADGSGLMARWTVPVAGAVFAAGAFLTHRGTHLAPDNLARLLVRKFAEDIPVERSRRAFALALGVVLGTLLPVWTALLLDWWGVPDRLQAYGPLGWAFASAVAAHFLLRRYATLYANGILAFAGLLAAAAVYVALLSQDQTVLMWVLYGVTALTALYRFFLKSETPLYAAAIMLPVPVGVTLELEGLPAMLWSTPLIGIATAYILFGLLLRDRLQSTAGDPLYLVGYAMSGVGLAWALTWVLLSGYYSAVLEETLVESVPLLTQRLLVGSGLLTAGLIYAIRSYRNSDPRFAHLAAWTFAAGLGLMLVATPLALGGGAIAVAMGGSVYAFAGVALRPRAQMPWALLRRTGVFSTPLLLAGQVLALLSLALATYDLWARGGDLASANAVYLIDLGLLAAMAYLLRAPMYAFGAALLFTLPYTLSVYSLFGITSELIELPSAALAFGWAVLAVSYVAAGLAMERLWSRYSIALPVVGYLLLAGAAVAAQDSTESRSIVYGVIVAVAAVSAVLTHLRMTSSLVGLASTGLKLDADHTRRYLALTYVGIASAVAPIWTLEVLSLSTTDLAHQGVALALLAPIYAAGALAIQRRSDPLYALPIYTTAIVMTIAGPWMAIEDEWLRTASLLSATVAYAMALAGNRRPVFAYPLLVAGHLAFSSVLTLSDLDLSLAVMGVLFTPAALIMAGLAGLQVRRAGMAINVEAVLRAWATPFILFALVDVATSLVLAARSDGAALAVTLTYAVATAFAASYGRVWVLAYASTAFTTGAVFFASRLANLDWSETAIVWAAQGLLMWWASQASGALSTRSRLLDTTRERFGIWTAPMRNSGTRLSWFALGFVVVNYFLRLIEPDSFGDEQIDDVTAVLAVLGLLYLGMAFISRRPVVGYLAVGLLLSSWTLQLADFEIRFAQVYAIPGGVYLMGIGFFERRRTEGRLAAFIELGAVLLLTVSLFVQTIVEEPAWPYALLLAVESMLLVLWGSANTTKIAFVGGIAAFAANVIYQTTDLLSSLPGAAVGLIIGMVLVFLIAGIEWRREQLITAGRAWSARLNGWAW